MDQFKDQAVLNWPTHSAVKQLQRCLGFANIYQRFIHNFSSLDSSLTSLLQGKPHKLQLSEDVQHPLRDLKHLFISEPILKHPDPELPFVVELDAS